MTNKQRMAWFALCGVLALGVGGAVGYGAPSEAIWALAGIVVAAIAPDAVKALGRLRG